MYKILNHIFYVITNYQEYICNTQANKNIRHLKILHTIYILSDTIIIKFIYLY